MDKKIKVYHVITRMIIGGRRSERRPDGRMQRTRSGALEASLSMWTRMARLRGFFDAASDIQNKCVYQIEPLARGPIGAPPKYYKRWTNQYE